jgi:D-alanine-D-alanine ligase
VAVNVDYAGQAPDEEGDDEPPSHVAAAAVAEVAVAVQGALSSRGVPAVIVGVDHEPSLVVDRCRELDARAVFNLVESLGGDPRRESEMAAALSQAGIPYTGCGPEALKTANAKDRVRALLARAGLPQAAGVALWPGRPDPVGRCRALGWPRFVKPARQDGSLGIDEASVVTDEAALEARVRLLWRAFGGPVAVEEFLPGPELSVALLPPVRPGLLGPAVVTTLDFDAMADPGHRIVTYDCKWEPDSPAYVVTSVPAAGRFPAALLRQARAIARSTFALVGGRAYGRVDMRLDAAGRPCVIDVNPNPDLDPDAGFARAARSVGLDYPTLVGAILAQAAVEETHVAATHRPDGPRVHLRVASAN